MRTSIASIFPIACIISLGLLAPSNAQTGADREWTSLMDQIKPAQHTVAGTWDKSGEALRVKAKEGARLTLPAKPGAEYDLRVQFTRRTGQHSVGVVVVHKGKQVGFEVDAWGMNLVGFQNLNGISLRDQNLQKKFKLENGRRYSLTVEVREKSLRAMIDDKEVGFQNMENVKPSLADLWSMRQKNALGLLAWDSETDFHRIEIRANGEESIRTGDKIAQQGMKPTVSQGVDTRQSNAKTKTSSKHVLIVIANHHFFYREYADPKEELERAGFRVTVAAGRVEASRPHSGSGEPSNGGVVMPDLSLAEVKARDFDAILFSGGWGDSMYQFAFEGRYDEPSYNGNRAIKEDANRIINEFIEQDKYVAALCNGTSVLAWARVNGTSPLKGKLVCAPTREAASGIYNGRRLQPSCRWHAENNGARMSPPGAIGQPNTAADDVAIDGKILTGEDDISAREMGRRLVEVLSK